MTRPLDPANLPPILLSGEVGQLFRVDARTVARWTHRGLLPCFRTAGGHRRYHRADVLALYERTEGDAR